MAENARGGSLLAAALEVDPRTRSVCGVAKALQDHPDRAEDISELLAAVPSRIQYRVASKILRDKADILLSDHTLSRHVRGVCSCRS